MSSEIKKSNWLGDYSKFNISKLESSLTNNPQNFWDNLGQKRALNIFHSAAVSVPAYRDFLKKNKIAADKIKTIADFTLVPPTDKENYISRYPLAERCWNGQLANSKIIASSSGTSGQPNYWPRNGEQELEASITHELLFRQYFKIQNKKTLAIVGFPMGVYVSGMATSLPLYLLSQKYQMSLVSAGNNKAEALKAVKNLSKNFDQILLIGHPFFIKDILETGKSEGVKWQDHKVGIMFCSEGFNEAWREYLLKEAEIKDSGAFNTYGSSEFLLMAYETRLSIKARKLLEKNKALATSFLGSAQVPNLFQYNPALRYIEENTDELLFTSNSGVPLIRFNLHDSGKIIPYKNIVGLTKNENQKNNWRLPFLSLKGRSDYTIIFYAANIYPQHIHAALNHKTFLSKITGKFTMVKGYRKNMDEYLEINIELRPKIAPHSKFRNLIQHNVIKKLMEINAEYNFLWHNLNKDLKPQIKLWSYQNEKYFKPGLKPKYIQ